MMMMKSGVFLLLPLASPDFSLVRSSSNYNGTNSSIRRTRRKSRVLLGHSSNCSHSRIIETCSVSFLRSNSSIPLDCSRAPGKSRSLRLRIVGKTLADVKSDPYDVAESAPESVKFPEGRSNLIAPPPEEEEELWRRGAIPWWEQLPKRWLIVFLCFSAFLLCNMDRVNMSIAILPMSVEYNWNPATVGLIQSSFFWGYLLTQIAGGIWADTVGGKLVLGFGVIWWSIATVLTPVAAKLGLPFLLVTRAFMGVGEGVAMPAMNNILSKWVPVSERSRSLALVYSGMYLGSVTGLAFSPLLIHKFGWPSVFYSFGSLGTVWFAIWLSKAHSSPLEDPELKLEEKKFIIGKSVSKEPVKTIPWRLILSKAPVWALIVSHFCHNWGTFILLTWMPTYYNQKIFSSSKGYTFCHGIRALIRSGFAL